LRLSTHKKRKILNSGENVSRGVFWLGSGGCLTMRLHYLRICVFYCLMCVCLANAHGLSALTLNFIFICRFSFKFACVRKMRFEGWMYIERGIEPRAR
jgi:hypothetical protein